jgi:hypothetical protein
MSSGPMSQPPSDALCTTVGGLSSLGLHFVLSSGKNTGSVGLENIGLFSMVRYFATRGLGEWPSASDHPETHVNALCYQPATVTGTHAWTHASLLFRPPSIKQHISRLFICSGQANSCQRKPHFIPTPVFRPHLHSPTPPFNMQQREIPLVGPEILATNVIR